MKKLKIQRETVRVLLVRQLRYVNGGVITIGESDNCGTGRCGSWMNPWTCLPPPPESETPDCGGTTSGVLSVCGAC